MSCVEYCTTLKLPCVRWLATMEDIRNIHGYEGQILRETNKIWEQYKELMGTRESVVQCGRSRGGMMVFFEAEEKLSVLSFSELALNDNESKLGDQFLKCMPCLHLNLFTTCPLNFKNVKESCGSISIIGEHSNERERGRKLGKSYCCF